MNEQVDLKISALVDNELEPSETSAWLDKVAKNTELQRKWRDYHLIGDLMREQVHARVDATLAQRVSAALVTEPTVLAPRMRSSAWQKRLRPFAGVAVAATVASIAVIGLQPDSAPQVEPVRVVQQASAPIPMPVQVRRVPGTNWELLEPVRQDGVATTLNDYLVNHNEFAANRGMQGMLQYVRIAGYDDAQ